MPPSLDLSLLLHAEVWTASERRFSEYLAVSEAAAS